MPAIGLYCSKTNKCMSFEEGINYFEEVGAMPAEAVIAIVRDVQSHEGKHARLSPSMCNEETTCRRQIVLERFVDYYLDPVVVQEAREGQLCHETLQQAGKGLEGWDQEVTLPPKHDPIDPPITQPTIDPDDGKACYEVFPGVFMRGRADKLKDDITILTDFKTSKYPKTYGGKPPKTDWGEKSNEKDWPIQLGMYRHMVGLARGKMPDDLRVWRMYRGSHDKSKTWRRFTVPVMHINTIWRIIGDFVKSTTAYLKIAMRIEKGEGSHEEKQQALKEFCKTIPADGYDKKMFYGKKCYNWCAASRICLGELMGKTQF